MKENLEKRRRCLQRIQSILRSVLADEELSLSEDQLHQEIPGWDQATHLAVVSALEKAFAVRFTTREVGETGQPACAIGRLIDIVLARAETLSHDLRSSLSNALSEGHRRRLLQTYAQEQLAGVLGIPPFDGDSRKTFQDMGVTSLSAIELCSRLELGLGITLSPSAVYNYPSIEQLVPHLAGKLQPRSDSRDLETNSIRELERR